MLLTGPVPDARTESAGTEPYAPDLSVIVPFAPDETAGGALLDQLRGVDIAGEIILVRSGSQPQRSSDAVRRATPVRECTSPAGRARQMNAGARAARGCWLWFLHADSGLHPDTVRTLRAFLTRGDALGYFDLRFANDGPWLVLLNAVGANWRSRWLGLPFGDQGFVLPAARFAQLGGYDETAVYGEDHLLVWRARAAGLPVRRIGAPLLSSARKYAERGWLQTSCRHLQLTFRQAWPHWREVARARRNRRPPELPRSARE